jgi:pimeloyl-CoA synthetase
MIIDILKERKINLKKPFETIQMEEPKYQHFEIINMIVEDLKNVKQRIENIEDLKQNFKESNDPSESNQIYKRCMEEHKLTDALIKKAKKMLDNEQTNINSKQNPQNNQKIL